MSRSYKLPIIKKQDRKFKKIYYRIIRSTTNQCVRIGGTPPNPKTIVNSRRICDHKFDYRLFHNYPNYRNWVTEENIKKMCRK